MKRLIYKTDLHGNTDAFRRLLNLAKNTDALIIGGDITPKGGISVDQKIQLQRQFLQSSFIPEITAFCTLHSLKIFVMMGNDDFRVNMDILEDAERSGIITLLHNRSHRIGQYCIAGYSYVNPTPFNLKDWEKGEFDSTHLQGIRSVDEEAGSISDDLRGLANLGNPRETVYVFHAPPFGTNLDLVSGGIHVGSKAIRLFIEEKQPLLTLHGHIHESPLISGSHIDKIGRTICINPGSSPLTDDLNALILNLANLNEVRVVKDEKEVEE
ncbi:MAG: metallophosphoesterase [archaeon]